MFDLIGTRIIFKSNTQLRLFLRKLLAATGLNPADKTSEGKYVVRGYTQGNSVLWEILSDHKIHIGVKSNGYQSIHITLLANCSFVVDGIIFDFSPGELQLRTEEHHLHAECRDAAHDK
jgi:hypothetical protein